MGHILYGCRLLVATISLMAILAAPIVILNTEPAPAAAGYGISNTDFDWANVRSNVDGEVKLVALDKVSF